MIYEFSAFLALNFGLLGLLIGSFLNVCVYRIPRRESVVVGRSHCPDCGHTLGPADLVPVLSYLALGRRCRYCHRPISPRYATVELLAALSFALSGFVLGAIALTLDLPVWSLFVLPLLDCLALSAVLVRLLIDHDKDLRKVPLQRRIAVFFLADGFHLAAIGFILHSLVA